MKNNKKFFVRFECPACGDRIHLLFKCERVIDVSVLVEKHIFCICERRFPLPIIEMKDVRGNYLYRH